METFVIAVASATAAVFITVQFARLTQKLAMLEHKISTLTDSQQKITEYWMEYPDPEEIVQQAVQTNISISNSPELQEAWSNFMNKNKSGGAQADVSTKNANAPYYTG